MANQVQLKDVIDTSLSQTAEEGSMLLGQTLHIAESDCINTNKISLFSDMDDAIFVAVIEAREEYQGQFYLIFTLRDAILLSGLLLGIPMQRISEKRKLAIMEADDVDAFGEIMNQIIGSFNSVFKSKLPEKIHLKLSAPKKFVPGIDEMTDNEPVPEDEYVLFRAQMGMDGIEMDRVDLMIPRSFAYQIEPPVQETQPAASTEANAEAGETPGEKPISSGNNIVLILEDDEKAREFVRDCLSAAGMTVVVAPLRSDMRDILANNDARIAVIGVADTEDRELALCIKINAMRQERPISIIMCAPQWTRTGVLKALKYGAKDIVMKPYDSNELVNKVSRFLKAA